MKTRIIDIAEVLPGMSLQGRAEHDPAGTHQVIMTKHLKVGQVYRYLEQHRLRILPKRSPVKYLVKSTDILFVSRGTNNHAVMVESVPENTIASGTLYILRPKAGVDPAYLAWCINQIPIQAEIAQARTGAGTPIVQRDIFREINLPLPELVIQNKIARLSRIIAKERRLREALDAESDNLHRLLGKKLINLIT